VKVGEGLT
jgi:hypothetical protein